MYNLTLMENATSMVDFITTANTYTDSSLMQIFMISFFIILLLVLKRYEFDVGLATSSFICFGISLFLSYAKLLPFMYPIAFFIMTAFAIFYLYLTKP